MHTVPARQAYRDVVEKATVAARAVDGVTDPAVRVRRIRTATAATEPPVPTTSSARKQGDGPDSAASLPEALVEAPPLVLPDGAPTTLTEALRRAARDVPERGTTYVLADGREERQTYPRLLDDAARLVPGLRAAGLRPGDSVLLHCDDNRNFVTGFWGCLLGGFVPTPIGMAPGYEWENATTRRIRDAWELLDRPPVLTDAAFVSRVERLRGLWSEPGLVVLAVEGVRADRPPSRLYEAGPDDPAVHLLTSGSTGVPKCVRHTHRTVVTRAYVNAKANGFGSDDITLNFMPLDHVAGMVMHNLRDVILQCEHVNARTESFLGNPLRWLDWIERYRATNTSAPNFVVTLVTTYAERISQGDWDLSSLRDITNGGEAIVSRTMHEFLRLLEPHGMAPDVMRPAWGMSEVCGGMVHSTLSRDDEKTGVVTVDARTLHGGGAVSLLPRPTPGHPTFTELGVPVDGTAMRIVDADDRLVREHRIGRLQVRGVTLMTGYHANPEAQARAFTADGWFDTGDLAFVREGRLVMTGREKDLIVIRSVNYPCHEIESVVERVDGVLPTFVAACSEHDSAAGTDELVVFCSLTETDPQERQAVLRAVGAALAQQLGLLARLVVPVPRDAFPKTSAGKLERAQLMAQYQAGAFDDELDALGLRPGVEGEVPETTEDWLFHDVWASSPSASGAEPTGVWLALGHADLADRLRTRRGFGAVVSVSPGPRFERLSDTEYRIRPVSPSDHAALRAAVERDHGQVGALVHAWATDRYDGWAEAEGRGLELAALSVHALIKAFADTAPRLIVVTTGACAVTADDPLEPVHATVNGLVRTAGAERGATWVRQLDLPPAGTDPADLVLAELADATDDEIVVYRDGRRLASRIRPVEKAPEDTGPRIRQGGLYLITGGLGGLGFHLARHLLTAYGTSLVLVGRSPASGDREHRLAELARAGHVSYRRADVADAEALEAIVAESEDRHGRPLDGVLHLAGADITRYWNDLESHLLAQEVEDEFRLMYRAKVLGTHALATVLTERPGADLVLFSSVNGHFGGAAFGAYASASSFLPAFARYWRGLGRTVQCQAWSLWTDGGPGTPGAAVVDGHGFRPVTPENGVRLFIEALSRPETNLVIGLDDSNERIAREIDADHLDGFEALVSVATTSSAVLRSVREAVRSALPDSTVRVRGRTSPETRTGVAADGTAPGGDGMSGPVAGLAGIWSEALGTQATDQDANFSELGGNSMTAIRLVNRVNSELGTDLVVQQLYEHPTLRELAAEIARMASAAKPHSPEGRDA